jgi:hypothetical protein
MVLYRPDCLNSVVSGVLEDNICIQDLVLTVEVVSDVGNIGGGRLG